MQTPLPDGAYRLSGQRDRCVFVGRIRRSRHPAIGAAETMPDGANAYPTYTVSAAKNSKRNAIQVHAGIRVIEAIPDIRPAETLIIVTESGVEVQLVKAHPFRLIHNMAL